MESSGLAVAAPAPSLPNGITTKDTSNHMAMQQMSLPDPTHVFALPTQKTTPETGVGQSAIERAEPAVAHERKDEDNMNSSPAAGEVVSKPDNDALEHDQPESSMLGEALVQTAADTMASSGNDLVSLDTPARPTHDHGIESGVRDTLDTELPENGLFKVESLPHSQAPDLSLYESFSAPHAMPAGQDFSNSALLTMPSTPVPVQGTYTASPPVAEEPNVHQAYAMLKFPDSYYYVKSVNIMITRDEHFYKLWREQKKELRRKFKAQRRAQETLDNYAREPSHHSQYGGDDVEEDLVGRPVHGLLSTYSDVGGAVSYVDPDSAFEPATALMQRTRRSKNNSSSNHSIAPRSLHEFEYGDELQGDIYHDSEGRAFDPQEWAQVAIHPQNAKDIEKISREHLIIRYDGLARTWVMDVIGNRVLHNGTLRSRGDTDIVLSHDDEIIIISVSFRFMLPADQEPDVLDSVEYDEDDDDDDELETSPAARRMADTIDMDSGEEGESSEEDVPLALQHKPSKGKGKRPKGKEPKPKLVKLKLTNKNASKKAEGAADTAKVDEKKEKTKGKAPAKTGGKVSSKTGGKLPAKATKTMPKAEETAEEPVTKEEVNASKSSGEEQVLPSTEVPPADAAQALLPMQATQASPPAPINLDANSAFAGADPSQLPQKRKGPGRPPKNGLISKRDDAGVKRKMKEYERQGLALPPMNELLEMVRAEQRQKDAAAKAASRGEAAPDMGMQTIDPRMQSYNTAYPSSTPTQPQQAAPTGSGSSHELSIARSTSPRPRRPAKSPSPMPAQETFSEEQLKKPTITYVFIIDEILQDPALDGQADLQTIYDKIQKRWPYFKYGTTTNGWQSSVRHNLLQCPRFVESGKSGKGKYWKINFEHELDPKKRKQVTPPPSAMPRNGSHAPPYQQTYNASYPQGGHMYQSPYNAGAYSAAGPSGSGNAPAMGQPSNGQYTQPAYGQQPNGNRPPSQQPAPPPPQTPQHYATIVQAIISYQTQFMEPHKDKPTYGPAEDQFNLALNHYSELHAGNTPPTEGKVDETQDPFKTLKQIFILYGQGDTRGSQTENAQNTTPSTTAPPAPTAPTAINAPGAPVSSTNTAASAHAPNTNALIPATALPSTQPVQPAQPSQAAHSAASVTEPLGATNRAPMAVAVQAPLQQAGPPGGMHRPTQHVQTPLAQAQTSVPPSQQNQPPAVMAAASQTPRPAPIPAIPAQTLQSRPPAAVSQVAPQPSQAAPHGTAVQNSTVARPPSISTTTIARPPHTSPSVLTTSNPGSQHQPARHVPASSSITNMPPIANGSQLIKPPASVNSGPTHSQAQPATGNPASKVAGPEQKPLVAGTTPDKRVLAAQQPSSVPKSVPAGSLPPSVTTPVTQPRPPPPATDLNTSRSGAHSALPSATTADRKRSAEASNEAQEVKRPKIELVSPPSPSKAASAEPLPGIRPTSAGVKRTAEGDGEDHDAKRLKTAQEPDSHVPVSSVTA